jgi:non-specific serine/threonine protein kinase
MLETIRELAAERLAASGEEPAIRAGHARWYLAVAEDGGPNRRGAARAGWFERVGRERENLRAALAWAAGDGGDLETGLRIAAGLGPFWVVHGLTGEGRRVLAELRARSPEPGLGYARAVALAGFLELLNGDLEGGERACREGLTLSRPGEEWYLAVCLNVLGTVARYRGQHDEAQLRYDEALALVTQGDLWWPAALAHTNIGVLAGLEGRHAAAVEQHERALSIARAGGDAWMVASCLMNAGRAIRQLGDLDRARTLQGEALRAFAKLENAWGVAACLDALAGLAADQGHHVRAARLYGAEEALRERARVTLWPTIRAEHEEGVQATASALGPDDWGQAHLQGRALTQEEAIAEAMLHPSLATG